MTVAEAELAEIDVEIDRDQRIAAALRELHVDDDAIASVIANSDALVGNAVDYFVGHVHGLALSVAGATEDDLDYSLAVMGAGVSALLVLVAGLAGRPGAAASWLTAWLRKTLGAGSA